MNVPTLPLTGLSSVRGKSVVARFDGMLSSNSGVLALAEVEKRLRLADVWRAASMIRAARTKSSIAYDRLPDEDDCASCKVVHRAHPHGSERGPERALRAAAQSDLRHFSPASLSCAARGLMSRTSLWRGRAWGAPGQVSPDIGANRPEMNRPYGLLRMSEKWNWMMFNAE